MKEKIAILLDSMLMGGIPKISIEFMKRLSAYYDVTLFLRRNEGELVADVPSCVNIIILPNNSLKNELTGLLKKVKILSFLFYFFSYIYLTKIKQNYVLSSRVVSKLMGPISNQQFDLAINYHGMHIQDITDVLYRINAFKKVSYIHGGHSFVEKKVISAVTSDYQKFDKIFCVSEATRTEFLADFPSVNKITEVYYNPIDKNAVLNGSKEKCKYNFDSNFINILTVGRIDVEKGQALIPPVMRKLIDNGFKVKWYIVGDGTDRQRIERMVGQYKVANDIIFAGVQINPYPFIKKCDIYVQPSYNKEGYSTTICETAILGKAIIGTDSGGIREQIEDRKSGFIVEPTTECIYDAIVELINDPKLKKEFEKNVLLKDFSNEKEINKIFSLIGE